MRYALSRRSRAEIARFTASPVLFVFDFDGTLAPIVADPERAAMTIATRAQLIRLARNHPCMVLSGRKVSDLRTRLKDTGVRYIIGNHGAEPWRGSQRARRLVTEWKNVMEPQLQGIPGAMVEDKSISLTIHYRHCREKPKVRALIHSTIPLLRGVRLVEGKEAVSLVANDAPNKGTALQMHLNRLKCKSALFIGDDITDEDVFELTNEHLLTIRIGRRERSRATYYLRQQHEIDELLRLIGDSANSGATPDSMG